MNKTLSILVAASLAFALAAIAQPPHTHEERIIKLKLSADGSVSTFDISDLEDGDSQTFYLDDGREIVIYNNGGNIEITLDGEPLDLPTTVRKEVKIVTTGDGGEEDIIVRHIDGEGKAVAFVNGKEIDIESLGGDGKHFVFIGEDGEVTTGGEGGMEWHAAHGDGAHKVRMHISRPDPVAHLLASGVLDDVDEETKQRIIDTLKELGPHGPHGAHKVMVIEKEVEDDGEE